MKAKKQSEQPDQPEITITGNPSPKAAKAIIAMVKRLIKNGTVKSAGYVWHP